MGTRRVCLGEVLGAHGVRGLVRVRAFTEEPDALAAYGPVEDEAGARRFALEVVGRVRGAVLARLEGVSTREAAQALAGMRLYVARAALPEIEEAETYYHADLIGLVAEDPDGRPLGRVSAVHDFGAGDVLELAPREAGGEAALVPFTRAAVPRIDVAGGRIVVDLPEEEQEKVASGPRAEAGRGG